MTLDRTYEEAATWLVRQQGDAMDWDGFTHWLEADPRNRSAYDELALIDSELGENAARLSQAMADDELHFANHQRPVRWGRWAGFGGGAIAAGLAAVLWIQPVNRETSTHDYWSAPGRTLRITLENGGSVLLAPASRLSVRGEDVNLQGSAFFDIPHQQGRALTISAGEFQVTDIGTRFAIENEPSALSVEVAQGSVTVSSNRLSRPVSLATGQGLIADRFRGTARLTALEPQQVASWRTGKLQFDNAPLMLVAQEISRYSDEKVTVAPEIANQPFSGVIAISHGEAPSQILAEILSLEVKRVDGAVRLQPRRK